MSEHLHSKLHFDQKHLNPGNTLALQNLLSVALIGNFHIISTEWDYTWPDLCPVGLWEKPINDLQQQHYIVERRQPHWNLIQIWFEGKHNALAWLNVYWQSPNCGGVHSDNKAFLTWVQGKKVTTIKQLCLQLHDISYIALSPLKWDNSEKWKIKHST